MIKDIIDDATADDPCLPEKNVHTAMAWLQDYIDWIKAAGTGGDVAYLTVSPEANIGDVSELAWSSDALIDRVEHTQDGIRVRIKPISATDEYNSAHQ